MTTAIPQVPKLTVGQWEFDSPHRSTTTAGAVVDKRRSMLRAANPYDIT
jgi:hypothetical protein